MNLRTYLKEQSESTLWYILADIAMIMQNRPEEQNSGMRYASTFWICCANEVKEELDRRLIDGYDNDDLDDCED